MDQFPIIPATDEEYIDLLTKYPKYFVLQTGKSEDSPCMVHYARCMHIRDLSNLRQGDSYVTKGKIKVISPKIEHLKDYVRNNKTRPAIIQRCQHCKTSEYIVR